MSSEKQIYLASLIERTNLTKPGSGKITKHLVLKVPEELTYEVGDSLAVYPENDSAEVEALMNFFDDALIQDPRSKEWRTLSGHLTAHAHILELTRGFLKLASERLLDLKVPEERSEFKEYLKSYTVAEFFEFHPSLSMTAQELVDLLGPILPRFYSIASSPNMHPGEVHLTVAYVEYELEGRKRRGLATHYLCNQVPLGAPVIPVYVQPHRGFTLPEEGEASIIMIGPGTGIAPFRAFLQERLHRGCPGKHWLFFGERTSSYEFFYEEFWSELVDKGILELDCAFSRDQPTKVYVQHRMKEKKEKLYEWLKEGAYIYVCGDAKRMAKDVEETLLEIFKESAGLSDEEAKEALKELRKQGRYHKDVY